MQINNFNQYRLIWKSNTLRSITKKFENLINIIIIITNFDSLKTICEHQTH